MDNRETYILELLRSDGEKAISILYDEYFHYLYITVFRILKEEEGSKDIVQAVFIEMWKRRDQLNIDSSLKQYLKRSAINKSLNYIRKNKRIVDTMEDLDNISLFDKERFLERIEVKDLEQKINAAIDSLPEKCRLVFVLSRYENMSHRQIAEKMDISTKTVENQITKALKILRYKIFEKKG